jgi:hypothetical protein
MEELKTHQVHRLPTEDEIKPDSLCVDPIFGLGTIILKHGEECFYSAHSSGGSITTPWKRNLGDRLVNQHLYFTIDEEIKEGDWFYNSMNNIVVKATNRYSEMKNPIPHRKITASTDPKLETSDEVFHNTYKQKLPQIPQDFIKDYCDQGGIDEVDVEYEYHKVWDKRTEELLEKYLLLKVDPKDNTITTHSIVEKMYGREDIIQQLSECLLEYRDYAWKDGLTLKSMNEFKREWIKENL